MDRDELKKELDSFGWHFTLAAARLFSLIIFIEAHRLVDRRIPELVPEGWDAGALFLRLVFFSAFSLAYVALATEMAAFFVMPFFRRARSRVRTEPREEQAGNG